jgi:tetratricopeptide (TPR) repeat protein
LTIQVAVLVLENFIEWLGQEPERNWEVALFMRGLSVRPPSTDALVRHARRYADRGEAERALRLYIRVLETDPDRTDVLDAAAELLAELGDVDGAKDLLLRSVELSPDKGCGKYVLLGHLEHGSRAVECFQKGYELLKGATAHEVSLPVPTPPYRAVAVCGEGSVGEGARSRHPKDMCEIRFGADHMTLTPGLEDHFSSRPGGGERKGTFTSVDTAFALLRAPCPVHRTPLPAFDRPRACIN